MNVLVQKVDGAALETARCPWNFIGHFVLALNLRSLGECRATADNAVIDQELWACCLDLGRLSFFLGGVLVKLETLVKNINLRNQLLHNSYFLLSLNEIKHFLFRCGVFKGELPFDFWFFEFQRLFENVGLFSLSSFLYLSYALSTQLWLLDNALVAKTRLKRGEGLLEISFALVQNVRV